MAIEFKESVMKMSKFDYSNSGIGGDANATISDLIEEISDKCTPEDTIKHLCVIREALEQTANKAAARTQLAMGCLEPVSCLPVPAWVGHQIPELSCRSIELHDSHPLAIKATRAIVSACSEKCPHARAVVQRAPLGHVVVDWHTNEGIFQLEIEAARAFWPNIKVNVLVLCDNKAESRIFYNIFDLVDYFQQHLGMFEGM